MPKHPRQRANARRFRLLALAAAMACCSAGIAAQRGIGTLKGVPVPAPAALGQYVADPQTLIVLGKALFWDVQVGSDGRTACATCHFHAGADHRVRNQVAGPDASTAPVRPNTLLTIDDFPFHSFADPNSNASAVTRERHDVAGSAGVVLQAFVGVADGEAADVGADTGTTGRFVLGGVKVRQVTARNTPTVINAVFNVRNFWDGRASNVFNGVTPFGSADSRAHVLATSGGTLVPEAVRLDASSLASQAVGPPLSTVEMSFDGRGWMHVGRKLLALTPLARQSVAADDSVLGVLVNRAGNGLRPDLKYDALVRASFQPAYWSSRAIVDSTGRVIVNDGLPARAGEFTQTELLGPAPTARSSRRGFATLN